MNIVLLRRKKGCAGLVTLSHGKFFSVALTFFVILPAMMLYTGYRIGMSHMRAHPDDLTIAVQSEVDTQRLKLAEVSRKAEENLNALALRLGSLQAHVIRLDALGQRLTVMANLEKGEFDFDNPPAQGGPMAEGETGTMIAVPDFVAALNDLSIQLDDRNKQLSVLETMLMSRDLQAKVTPTGRPVSRGWLSSFFGQRTDPFTGLRVHHSGVDFAGKLGSDVVTAAAGVVSFSGKRSGYGNMVEVNHGNGYTTRYGHNLENMVAVGETVKKGQVIAKMGTSGRSTGPHVHFEVMVNGRSVNPKKYINAAEEDIAQ